jgi:hypothetical protein
VKVKIKVGIQTVKARIKVMTFNDSVMPNLLLQIINVYCITSTRLYNLYLVARVALGDGDVHNFLEELVAERLGPLAHDDVRL